MYWYFHIRLKPWMISWSILIFQLRRRKKSTLPYSPMRLGRYLKEGRGRVGGFSIFIKWDVVTYCSSAGTASSKPCLWPITDTMYIYCQVWVQMLRSTNIFGTYPVTSASVNRKNYSQHFFKHVGIYKYYYLFIF